MTTNKLIAIVPIHNLWNPPSTLPFLLGEGVAIAQVPDEFRLEDANDGFRAMLIEASSLDAEDDAQRKVCLAYMALWFVKGTKLYFDRMAFIKQHGSEFTTLGCCDLSKFYPSVLDEDGSFSDSEYHDSKEIYSALCELHPATPIYSALKSLVKGLTDSEWQWKFICLWVAMETLFGASTEITFKLSQRVALFLGTSSADAKAIFQQTTKSYGFRSTLVHGLTIKKLKPQESLTHMADLEHQVRQCMIKIISDKKLLEIFQTTAREQYLANLAFDRSW